MVLEHRELLDMVLPTVRADFALCENYAYTPGKILSCPLSVFGGTEDPNIPEHSLAGWSTETSSFCRVRMFLGDHFFIHTCQAEIVRAVVEAVSTSATLFTPSP